MSTLADVYEFYGIIEMACELFGFSEEFREEFLECWKRLGIIIMEQEGVTEKEAINLPKSTELGFRAEASFREIKMWVYSLPTFSRVAQAH